MRPLLALFVGFEVKGLGRLFATNVCAVVHVPFLDTALFLFACLLLLLLLFGGLLGCFRFLVFLGLRLF